MSRLASLWLSLFIVRVESTWLSLIVLEVKVILHLLIRAVVGGVGLSPIEVRGLG